MLAYRPTECLIEIIIIIIIKEEIGCYFVVSIRVAA